MTCHFGICYYVQKRSEWNSVTTLLRPVTWWSKSSVCQLHKFLNQANWMEKVRGRFWSHAVLLLWSSVPNTGSVSSGGGQGQGQDLCLSGTHWERVCSVSLAGEHLGTLEGSDILSLNKKFVSVTQASQIILSNKLAPDSAQQKCFPDLRWHWLRWERLFRHLWLLL